MASAGPFGGDYAPQLNETGRVDWNNEAQSIYNLVRVQIPGQVYNTGSSG